jgi:hemoglobin-like flavoprotein
MTPHQVLLVKHSYRAASFDKRLAGYFLAELFARDPRLWRLFTTEPGLRAGRLDDGLASIVASIGRLHPIVPVLEWLALQGARHRIGPTEYESIGEALLSALESALDEGFTSDHADAWVAAYHAVAGVMRRVLAQPLAA